MAEEERETVWLVVVDGEGVGETRLVSVPRGKTGDIWKRFQLLGQRTMVS